MGKLNSLCKAGNQYQCDECKTIFSFEKTFYEDRIKGSTIPCLLCEATNKSPTPKPSKEEIEKKKAELKSR